MMNDGQVLRVENVCSSYGDFSLQNISLSLEKGYFMGLVGKNGAGKSSLMNIILGQKRKTSGKIYIDGIDIDERPLEAKQKIGFIVDGQPFLSKNTILENAKCFGPFYQEYSMDTFQYWLKRLELDAKRRVIDLSKGENKKLQLAFALAHNPSLLVLDEPTGNLDPVFRKEFIYILQDVIARQEVSVLMSTHLITDLERVADYIVLIDQGEICYSGTMEEILQHLAESSGRRTLADWMYQVTKMREILR